MKVLSPHMFVAITPGGCREKETPESLLDLEKD